MGAGKEFVGAFVGTCVHACSALTYIIYLGKGRPVEGGANLNKTGGWGGVTQRSPKYATAHMYACVRNVFVFVSTYHCAFINACVCASVRACPKMCEFVCAYVYSA